LFPRNKQQIDPLDPNNSYYSSIMSRTLGSRVSQREDSNDLQPADLEGQTAHNASNQHSADFGPDDCSSEDHNDDATKEELSEPRIIKPNWTRTIYLLIALASLVGVGYGMYVFLESKGIVLKPTNTAESANTGNQVEITREELALHNTAADCWLEIYGSVYNLTEYAGKHPGGASLITSLAGMEATEQFSNIHNEKLLQTISYTKIGKLVASVSISTGNTTGSGTTGQGSSTSTQISMSELAIHSTNDDLWLAIHGVVYDLTSYNHPGGRSYLINYAGTDATDKFDAVHKLSYLDAYIKNRAVGTLAQGNTISTATNAPTNNVFSQPSVTPITFQAPVQAPVQDPEETPEEDPEEDTEQAPVTPPVAPPVAAPVKNPTTRCYVKQYTLQDVANNGSSLWMALYGQIYSFQGFRHPGGDSYIQTAAGTDAVQFFETVHKQSLLYDSSKGAQNYWIGELANVTGQREVAC